MNNKGFAITTVLYGTFLLFLLLLLLMLKILSNYKNNMDLLIEKTNGARDIVDIYKKNSLIMTVDTRHFYKTLDGAATILKIKNTTGNTWGPVLISTNEDAVWYSVDDVNQLICGATIGCKWKEKSSSYCDCRPSGSVVHNGTTYYYSSIRLWENGPVSSTIDMGAVSVTNNDSAYLGSVVKNYLNNHVSYYK